MPKKKSAYHALEDEDECPVEYATVFSILTFSWMTPSTLAVPAYLAH